MSEEFYPCFGLDFLGQCGYNPNNPVVYFSIGQLLVLFVIAIAIYQILNPIIKLRIKSSRWFQIKIFSSLSKVKLPYPFQWISIFLKKHFPIKIIPALCFISIVSVFFSSIIPSIPNFYKFPIIGYPIAWEFLSGCILAFLGFLIIRTIIRPASLNKNNCEEFFNEILNIIDNNNEAELVALAKELTISLEKILSTVESRETHYMEIKKLAQEKYAKNQSVYFYQLDKLINSDKELKEKIQFTKEELYCYDIVNLLSDKTFCNVVSRKAPQFFEEFIRCLNSVHFIGHSRCKFILSNIMAASFKNKDSILNRENQIDGLSGVSNLTDLVFKNHTLLQMYHFTSLISFFESIEFKDDWQIKLYFSCLKRSLEFSFETEYHQVSDHIHIGIYKLKDFINKNFFIKSFEKKTELINSFSIELSRTLSFLKEHKGKIKVYHSNDIFFFPLFYINKYDQPHEVSLYQALAKSIFDLLLTLSTINEKNSNELFHTRLIGVNLLQSVSNTPEVENILMNYIKFHIDEMNFKKLWYPPLTKHMISIFGLYVPKEEKTEMDKLNNYLINKFKTEFHSLYTTDSKFALDLLPLNVSYNSEEKILTETSQTRFSKNITLQCN